VTSTSSDERSVVAHGEIADDAAMLVFAVVSLMVGQADVFASPCLGASFPAGAAALFQLAEDATWSETEDGPLEPTHGEPIVCSDDTGDAPRRRVWTISEGVATFQYVPVVQLRPLPKTSWKAYRRPEDVGGQTGCLRSFKRGTRLFDVPNGKPVAVVVASEAFLGKWETRSTPSAFWGGVRGFRSKLVWVKVANGNDWCPQ